MATTVIGPGITIEGEVTSEDEVVIAGVLKGKLEVEGPVSIESDGTVEADIGAHSVSIGGSVKGNVTATERVDLLSGGRLVGDVKAARLTIADGASFKGNVDMDV
ncbi:MAG: polymer-forming cytoskeletal protein [Myxococcales bacterium]|nr:polymer-forming cytoskeletal protein [Myxococcales bacterium]